MYQAPPTPPRLRILGDDLTGAAEAAAVFASPARPIPLRLDTRRHRTDGPVEAVDLNVRDAAPGGVRERYARAARGAQSADEVFVKIDSALRGPIRQALGGVLESLPDRPIVCAPASPAVRRVVRDGIVHVEEVPLTASDTWAHEARSAPARVADVLPREPVTVLSPEAVAGGELLRALARGRAPLIVCDALEEHHLARIAAEARRAGRPMVWVGAAGLARACAGSHPEPTPRRLPSPFLAVVGSASAAARAQARALCDAGARCVELDADQLERCDGQARRREAAAIAAVARRADVVVFLREASSEPISRARRTRLARALARLTRPALERTELAVLVGGATARAILTHASIARLEVTAELGAGMVASIAGQRRLGIVTKPGAFGEAGVLVDLLRGETSR